MRWPADGMRRGAAGLHKASSSSALFFFNDTATTEIYTLSLHDALPICGLDSLLEPTGNIKRAQDMAARAFGCDRVFFVTNGTSTSNKMVEQALLAPGDIAIVDRNCHKSHHYGKVMAGAQPYYVAAHPMTAYSMY